jgi:hypothetical protein
MRDIFILNKIWAQDKIYILVGIYEAVLLYNLNLTKVYINIEKYVIH